MRKCWNGFTLVELVITITILAILGVVSLIYIRPYLWHARNAARMDSNTRITSQVAAHVASELSILSLTGTGSEVVGASIAGQMAMTDYYKAGTPNHNVLSLKQEEFKDPISGVIYPLGVTSYAGAGYESAFTVESDTGVFSKVTGNWAPRDIRSFTGSGDAGSELFILSFPTDIGFLRVNDTVTGTGVVAGTYIRNVSKDGTTLALSNTLTGSTNRISFSETEVSGLIGSEVDKSIPVTEDTTHLPYGL